MSSLMCVVYSAWWWCAVSVSVACVLFAVLLARSDCDLLLAFYSRWGKKPVSALFGKVVWVTGASSGIGEELCYVLSKCGAIVVLSARREDELQRVLERCIDLSPANTKSKHMVLPMDLTETDKHASLVAAVVGKFGRIDYLVNNAGRSQRAEAVATELAVDRALMDLNVLSTLSLTKAVLPEMIECREGCVVVISSVAGKIGSPGSATYSASKHALQGFFDTLRMEVADKNISILSVCPGPIDTPFMHNIFTEKLSIPVDPKQPKKAGDERVSAERCAHLITVTMANKLEEVWISYHPILLFVYINQYLPNIAMWLGKRLGNKRLHAIKSGKASIDNFFTK